MAEASPASSGQASAVPARAWSLAPAAVGTAAFGLGLIALSSRPRSYDERVTIAMAGRSVSGIWHSARRTEAPHLVYYLLMKPWLAAFGTGLWASRFPSVVFGAAAALVLTALGIRLFGREAGLVAGASLATAAFVMQFSQWARGYALALALTVLAAYGFVRALEGPRLRWVLVWALGLVAACWVNLFAISALAAHVIAYALDRPRPRPRLAAAALLAVAVAVAPIVVLVGTADNGQLSWIPSPTLARAATQTWDWASRNPFALAAAAVGLVALVTGAARRASRCRSALVVGWTLSPFVVTLSLSAFQPAFDSHYLLTAAPGLALLTGVGVAALPRRACLLLGTVVAVGAGLQLAHYYVVPGKPFSSLF